MTSITLPLPWLEVTHIFPSNQEELMTALGGHLRVSATCYDVATGTLQSSQENFNLEQNLGATGS